MGGPSTDSLTRVLRHLQQLCRGPGSCGISMCEQIFQVNLPASRLFPRKHTCRIVRHFGIPGTLHRSIFTMVTANFCCLLTQRVRAVAQLLN